MLDNSVISRATGYWAAEFGCAVGTLFTEPLRIVHHRNSFADYHGVFGLFRQGAAIVSIPSRQADLLHPLLAEVARDRSPAGWRPLCHPLPPPSSARPISVTL